MGFSATQVLNNRFAAGIADRSITTLWLLDTPMKMHLKSSAREKQHFIFFNAAYLQLQAWADFSNTISAFPLISVTQLQQVAYIKHPIPTALSVIMMSIY